MTQRTAPTLGVTSDGWVSVGVVARAHGIRGALRIHLWNPDSDALAPDLVVKLGAREHRVATYAAGILTLPDVTDRNSAEQLQGTELFVKRADLPDADDLYLVDVVGAAVVDVAGRALGSVTGVTDNGAQPLLMVDHGGREVLVPYVDAIVVSADDKRIVLRPPAGLFDDADAVVVDDDSEREPEEGA